MPAVVGVDNVAIVAGGVSRETRQQWPPNLLQIFNVCRFSGTFCEHRYFLYCNY